MTERRDTVQQRAIREVCETSGRPLSIDEIFELAKLEAPSLGQRTCIGLSDVWKKMGTWFRWQYRVSLTAMNWQKLPPRITTTFIARFVTECSTWMGVWGN